MLKGPLCIPYTDVAILKDILIQIGMMVKRVKKKNIRSEGKNCISSSSISLAMFSSYRDFEMAKEFLQPTLPVT